MKISTVKISALKISALKISALKISALKILTLNNVHFHHDLNHASMSKYCPSIVYQMRSSLDLRGLDKAVM